MFGRIHRDKARPPVFRRPFGDHEAAESCLGREFLMPGFDIDDVLFAAEAREIGLPDVVLVQPGIAHVDLVERQGFRIGDRIAYNQCVHHRSSWKRGRQRANCYTNANLCSN